MANLLTRRAAIVDKIELLKSSGILDGYELNFLREQLRALDVELLKQEVERLKRERYKFDGDTLGEMLGVDSGCCRTGRANEHEEQVQHTPGPWRAELWENISGTGESIMAGNLKVCPEVYGRSYPECDANARLIAAAPDLLAACQRLVNLGYILRTNPAVLDSLLDDARAAIAGAEGKAE